MVKGILSENYGNCFLTTVCGAVFKKDVPVELDLTDPEVVNLVNQGIVKIMKEDKQEIKKENKQEVKKEKD